MKSSVALLTLLASLLFGAAQAAAMHRSHHHHWRAHHSHHHGPGWRFAPERHVVEGRRPPGSRVFLINGSWFTATSDACSNWKNGDRIRLLAGEWHGACTTAVFYNARRHMTCEMFCR